MDRDHGRRRGTDTAWPHSALVDGAFRRLLTDYEIALEHLAEELTFAEDGAARGHGTPETGIRSRPSTTPGLDQHLGRDGTPYDPDVRELRKIRRQTLKELRQLVHSLQWRLGLNDTAICGNCGVVINPGDQHTPMNIGVCQITHGG
jgi:hypothetical protein